MNNRKSSLKQLWRGLGLLVLAAVPVVAATMIAPSLFGTLLSRFGTIAEDRGSERLDIWAGAMQLVQEHPILGVGLDNFKVAIAKYFELEILPHSIYIGTLTELGIVGFVLLLLWITVLMRKAWMTPERIWVFPLLVAYLFQAAFLHEFYFSCFWLALGLVEGAPLLNSRAMSPATGLRGRVVVAS